MIACLALSNLPGPSPAKTEYKDPSLEIKETTQGGRYAIWIMPPKLLEATLKLETSGKNMGLNRKTPFTMDVSSKTIDFSRPTSILQASQRDTNQEYQFTWHYTWLYGLRGGKPDPHVGYSLPFKKGTRCTVNQGYFGSYSHQRGSPDQYALDFNQPEGTPVLAAREGMVIAVRSDSNLGGRDIETYKHTANYIVIKHADGTYGEYWHLQQNSPVVKLGQKVKRGQHIANVGATGAVTCSHLHFAVITPNDDVFQVTYPVKFETASGVVDPVEGETYIAE